MAEAIPQMEDLGMWVEKPDFRSSHLFGIYLDKSIASDTLQRKLIERRISVSFRGEAIRISPHVYNDKKDIDRLVRVLEEVRA